jgi:Na+/H+ antiporter NhaD/arsenite permease-like protein
MLIGTFAGLSYLEFLMWMFPVGVVTLASMIAILIAHYRRQLTNTAPPRPNADSPDSVPPLKIDRPLLTKSLVVLAGVLVGFVLSGELPLVALGGAVALILWSGRPATDVLMRVNWVLLLFFAALFIVVEGLADTGVVRQITVATRPLYGSTLATQVPIFSAVTVIASNVVSNVPFVILARDMIPELIAPRLMWLVLAMASTLAGNLTIPGSVATLIVLEAAKRECTVSFLEFLRVGASVTLATVALGAAVLGIEYWLWG